MGRVSGSGHWNGTRCHDPGHPAPSSLSGSLPQPYLISCTRYLVLHKFTLLLVSTQWTLGSTQCNPASPSWPFQCPASFGQSNTRPPVAPLPLQAFGLLGS